MYAGKVTGILQHVILYSPEWTKTTALQYLCGHSDIEVKISVETISDVMALFSRLTQTDADAPDIIVLDIPPRDYVGLLCNIRRLYPSLPMVITQERVLFSDWAVASWFGNIWLREYDSLMAGYPDTLISACITNMRFAGTYSSAACAIGCKGGGSDALLLNCAERWLCERLAEIIGSEPCAKVVTEWLTRGISAQELGKLMQRSEKLIYHCRSRVIQKLKISGHPRDFVSSLSLKMGPVQIDCKATCQMRIVK